MFSNWASAQSRVGQGQELVPVQGTLGLELGLRLELELGLELLEVQGRQLSYKEYLLDRSLVLDKTDSQEYRSRKKGKNKNNEVARNEFPRTKAWLNQFPDSDFDNVVNNGTGRCTSFAIQNVTRLGKAHGAHYEFDYYKLGVHHLARCRKSEIVIDSSSKYSL